MFQRGKPEYCSLPGRYLGIKVRQRGLCARPSIRTAAWMSRGGFCSMWLRHFDPAKSSYQMEADRFVSIWSIEKSGNLRFNEDLAACSFGMTHRLGNRWAYFLTRISWPSSFASSEFPSDLCLSIRHTVLFLIQEASCWFWIPFCSQRRRYLGFLAWSLHRVTSSWTDACLAMFLSLKLSSA